MHEMLWNILGSVIVVVIPILVKFFIDYLIEKRKKLQNDILNSEFEQFEKSILEAIDLVQKIVETVSQTYVDSLKAKGEFTEEAQRESFNMALETAKTLIPEETKKLIETVYSDLDKWLKVQIESYINSKKALTKS